VIWDGWRTESVGGERVAARRRTPRPAPDRPPVVSVGIPVFNGERYLARAIQSVLDQDFDDLEVVVVDNASTDSTGDIARRFAAADERVRYHRNDENLGAAANFRRAFALSSGRYFKWLAYDDWIEPTCIGACVDVLDREPETVLVFAGTTFFDESGQCVDRFRYPEGLSGTSPSARFVQSIWSFFATGVFGVARADVVASETRLIQPYKSSDRIFLAEMALAGGVRQLDGYLFNSTTTVSVRRGRKPDWWAPQSERPAFHRWHLFGDYLTLAWRNGDVGLLRRVEMTGAVVAFFARGWPRRALFTELRNGARYLAGWAPRAGERLVRRSSGT
jgi:glycosyltransferase involved in cell wall biosynthesis